MHELSKAGVSVWIDALSRELVHGGELARTMVEDAVVGITSNLTVFAESILSGGVYDSQLRDCALAGLDVADSFMWLAERDVADACEVLQPVWEQTNAKDGYVSIGVDPTLAYDTEETFARVMRFYTEIDRPNLLVEIPATRAGLSAIEDLIAGGLSINITLIFSLRRHREVIEGYLRGLERLVAAGGDPARVASVASFPVNRLDTETDKRLESLGRGDELKGKLGVASAKLAYQYYLQTFSGPRWQYLAGKGATPQRCLWASTSAKDPAYRDIIYVEKLIAPATIHSMSEETIHALQHHGEIKENTGTSGVEEAYELFDRLASAGIDCADVVATLEAEGVQELADSYAQLLDGIRTRREQLLTE